MLFTCSQSRFRASDVRTPEPFRGYVLQSAGVFTLKCSGDMHLIFFSWKEKKTTEESCSVVFYTSKYIVAGSTRYSLLDPSSYRVDDGGHALVKRVFPDIHAQRVS